jgi:hypothetical protein
VAAAVLDTAVFYAAVFSGISPFFSLPFFFPYSHVGGVRIILKISCTYMAVGKKNKSLYVRLGYQSPPTGAVGFFSTHLLNGFFFNPFTTLI